MEHTEKPVPLKDGAPQSVLFACTLNSVRSPMAEAMAKHLFGFQLYIDSAGVTNEAVDPFAISVMEEAGIDMTKHSSKTLADLRDTNFDVIIALSAPAHAAAQEIAQTHAIEIEFWDMQDPTEATGSRDSRIGAYRQLRDDLMSRLKDRFA